jgi:hypothetical protein
MGNQEPVPVTIGTHEDLGIKKGIPTEYTFYAAPEQE